MDPLNTIRLEINGAAQTQGPGKCHHACTKAPTLPRDVYPSLASPSREAGFGRRSKRKSPAWTPLPWSAGGQSVLSSW